MPAPLTKKDLLKMAGNTLTPDAFREAGIQLVPIRPDNSLAEDVLKAFIAAGQPEGRFFQRHLLVSPEEMESRRKTKSAPADFDPISVEALTASAKAAYEAMSPINLLGGTSVAAIDLIAYAAGRGFLSNEVTSTLARLMLPKGQTPIDPPEVLEAAALEWPYDPQAAEIARNRLAGRREVRPTAAMPRPTQVVNNGGAIIGQQINVPGDAIFAFPSTTKGRQGQLAAFLVARYGVDELYQLLRMLPGGIELTNAMPGREVPPATYCTAAERELESRGMVDRTFFLALLEARPRLGAEIQRLRNLYGV